VRRRFRSGAEFEEKHEQDKRPSTTVAPNEGHVVAGARDSRVFDNHPHKRQSLQQVAVRNGNQWQYGHGYFWQRILG
jgi:hypothetical protein